MREIKFRQWQGGQFHYWGFIDGAFDGPTTGGASSIKEALENSQQFTGLLDKNGKKYTKGIY